MKGGGHGGESRDGPGSHPEDPPVEEDRRVEEEVVLVDEDPLVEEELVLVELLSRVLDKGAVIAGDVVISVAGIDLVHLGLNLYLCSAETARRTGIGPTRPPRLREPAADEGR